MHIMSIGISKRVTLIITVITHFLLAWMSSSINIALPTIAKELPMDAITLSWIATSYLLTSAAFLVPFGRLADIFGQKKIFSFGIVILTISSLLCAVSNSAIYLILYRALSGIGASMTMGTVIAILGSVYPIGERGRVIGISVAAVYLGLSLGPFFGGVLTQHLGWRSIFFLSAFLGFVVTFLVIFKLRGDWADSKGEKFDIVGSIILCISLLILMYGFSMLPTVQGIILFLISIIGLMAFIWWEIKTESPIFNISVFKNNTAFIFSNLAALINFCAVFAVHFLFSLYLQYMKGFTPQFAGLIILASPVVMAIISPVAGRLSDRIESRMVAAAGMLFSCVALILFIFLTGETSLWFIISGLAIYGFGNSLFASPNMNAVICSVEKKFLGVASGTNATMRNSGMMLSMGIVMILFSIYIGQAQIVPEYYSAFMTSLKVGFTIFAALCFGGLFAQLAARNTATVL